MSCAGGNNAYIIIKTQTGIDCRACVAVRLIVKVGYQRRMEGGRIVSGGPSYNLQRIIQVRREKLRTDVTGVGKQGHTNWQSTY